MSIHIQTKSATQTWASPDGSRKIHEVVFETDGKLVKAKTFSDKIATVGFMGEVESYKKQGAKGEDTFIKQVPKEGGFGGFKGQPKDEKAIQAMWAISQSIAAHTSSSDLNVVELASVEEYAKDLFVMVERVKTAQEGLDKPTEPDIIYDEPEEL